MPADRKGLRADDTLALAIADAVPRDEIQTPSARDDVEPSLFTFSSRYCRAPIHHAVVKLVPMVKRKHGTPGACAWARPFFAFTRFITRCTADAAAYSIIDIDDSFIQLEVVRTQ